MISVDCARSYLGNYFEALALRHEIDLARSSHRLTEANLTPADCQKGRIYLKTNSGDVLGLLKRRDWQLTDGDAFSLESNHFLLVRLNAQMLMVLSLDCCPSDNALKLIHLGHVLGNYHYPIAVATDRIYIQIDDRAALLESTLKALDIVGLKIGYETQPSSQELIFAPHSHQSS